MRAEHTEGEGRGLVLCQALTAVQSFGGRGERAPSSAVSQVFEKDVCLWNESPL